MPYELPIALTKKNWEKKKSLLDKVLVGKTDVGDLLVEVESVAKKLDHEAFDIDASAVRKLGHTGPIDAAIQRIIAQKDEQAALVAALKRLNTQLTATANRKDPAPSKSLKTLLTTMHKESIALVETVPKLDDEPLKLLRARRRWTEAAQGLRGLTLEDIKTQGALWKAFLAFARKQQAAENVECWDALHEVPSLDDGIRLYAAYVGEGARAEINIDRRLRDRVWAALEAASDRTLREDWAPAWKKVREECAGVAQDTLAAFLNPMSEGSKSAYGDLEDHAGVQAIL